MKENVKVILNRVKEEGIDLNEEIHNIIGEYADPFDAKNKEIRESSLKSKGDLSIDELSAYVVELQSYLSYIAAGIEKIGIMVDNSKLIYTEQYNKAFDSIAGTEKIRTAFAENNSLDEQLVNYIYTRAYKSLQNRMTMGLESLSDLKKSLSVKSEQVILEKRSITLASQMQ